MTSQNFQEIDAQALKDANPIEDVIGQYLHLKRRGKDYVGLCPFHDEKSPSFTVSPGKQLYHCFGCGESGNVFNFLMKHQNINFREAVEELGGKISTNATANRTKTLPLKAKKAVKPIPFAVGGKFLKLPEIPCNTPDSRPISDENWAVIAGKDNVPSDRDIIQESIYKYSDVQEVRRFDWPDTTKPKGRDKTIRPFHSKAGKWQIGKGDDAWPIYRLDEVLDIAASNEETIYLFLVEGENNVEVCRAHGFAAITPRGGTWREEDLKILATARQKSGKNFALICLTDNDKHGQDMAKDIELACAKFGFSCLLISADIILPGIIEGGDIREILAEMDIEEFLRRVGEQISININAANAATIKPPQSNVISLPVQQRLSEEELEKEIKKIVEDDPKKSEVSRRLNSLANRTERRDLHAIKEQYQALKQEYQSDTEKPQQAETLKEIARLRTNTLNPLDYLIGDNGKLARQLIETAEAMPTSASWLFTTLIAASGSCIKADSKITINPKSGYKQSAIFRTLIVANTGAKKTPAQSAILDPLFKMELEEADKFNESKVEYEEELRQYESKTKKERADEPPPTPPIRKRYILGDATPEAIADIHGQNPDGFLVYRDEGSGFYTSLNKYRSGKGDDCELDLSEFNGKPLIVDRKSGSTCIANPHVCRTGSTQTATFKNLMGNFDDAAGYWARWLIDISPAPPSFIDLSNDAETGLSETLAQLYQALASQESNIYGLSMPAKTLWQEFQHDLTRELLATNLTGLQNVYPKLETHFGRFCLWLHLVNAALAGEKPNAQISADTVSHAISLTSYYANQWILFHSTQNPELASLTEPMLAIHEFAKRKGKPVTPRDLQSGLRQIKAISAAQIREWCEVLGKTAGYGSWDGKVYSHTTSADNADNADGLLTNCQQIQTHTPYSFDGFADNADTNSTLQKNTPKEETGIISKKEIYAEDCQQRQQTCENLTGYGADDADKSSANRQHCQQKAEKKQQQPQTTNTNGITETLTGKVVDAVDTLNETEIEIVEFIDSVISEKDADYAKDIQKIITSACDSGYANRQKIWDNLGLQKQAAFTALLNPKPSSVKIAKGVKVAYVGERPICKAQYGGQVLIVEKVSRVDGVTCKLPSGQLTTWLQFDELTVDS